MHVLTAYRVQSHPPCCKGHEVEENKVMARLGASKVFDGSIGCIQSFRSIVCRSLYAEQKRVIDCLQNTVWKQDDFRTRSLLLHGVPEA
jgi:hypothetical protein